MFAVTLHGSENLKPVWNPKKFAHPNMESGGID
jgi:hypothetical protein